jgi:ribosomal protein L20A (L18A)
MNGCGYFDGNAKSGDGWHKAQKEFREAWRHHAVENMLEP